MSKIKIMFILIFAYIIYKGVVSIMNFEIGVSKKVAEQMSIGVRARFKTDLSIGITGYAGPDGIDVGKVFISFSSRKGTVVNQFKFLGNREDIISQIIEACLSTLSSEIKLLICNGK